MTLEDNNTKHFFRFAIQCKKKHKTLNPKY